MNRIAIFATLAIGVLCATPARAQVNSAELRGIDDALLMGNMTRADLSYEKRIFRDKYRLSLVDQALDKPVDTADALLALHEFPRTSSMPSILLTAAQQVYPGETDIPAVAMIPADTLKEVPAGLRVPVANLLNWVRRANGVIDSALKPLTPAERKILVAGLPQVAVEEPSIQFSDWPTTEKPVTKEQIAALLDKVDVGAIVRAASQLATAVERIGPILNQFKEDLPAPVTFVRDGVTVLIAGREDDLHAEKDVSILIDLGGKNRYTGRHAVGIGAASVLLDLGTGSDVSVGDAGMAVGVLGIGIAKFAGGDSVLRGKSMNFGVGLAGVGAFAKESGNDVYRSVALAQGCGFFGIGLLVDHIGDDDYGIKLWGQGAARTRGFGWLVDRRGNDHYSAGGLIINSPLFTDVTYSFAQGCASGYREDGGGFSGGIGLLTDFSGSDHYDCDTYAQAASYWFGMGSLFDGAGNDWYQAVHYSQCSAMHLTAAYFFDLAGNDSYTVKWGACFGIGHDYGVAFMLDRAGDDIYTAKDGTPGIGVANGVGIFMDASGDDRYVGPPGTGGLSRSTGSLGLFVDLGGIDKYREGLADTQASVTPQWGIAYDVESLAGSSFVSSQPARPKPKPGTIPLPSEKELDRLYATATQWAVGSAQDAAYEASDRLIGIGLPALDWMIARKLSGADHLALRAYMSVVNGIGQPARERLAQTLITAKDDDAAKLLRVGLECGAREIAPFLPGFMKKPQTVSIAVQAAAILGGRECVADLMPLCMNDDKAIAARAMIALSEIGSEDAYSTAEAIVSTGDLLSRKAALKLMSKFKDRAIASALRLLKERNEAAARSGAELLSLVGSDGALNELGKLLFDPSAGVRAQAVQGLAGRCPEGYRASFNNMQNDPHPVVRALARRLRP